MTDTANGKRRPLPEDAHPSWRVREAEGLGREYVSRLLDPPVSAKTLERWEKRVSPLPLWRARQLAQIYRVRLADLSERKAVA